jgi:hypothetical protein
MATVKVIFHGTQVPNGEPLVYTQLDAIGSREEISTKMADAMACSSTIVFSSDNYTTILNKNHIAMIEVHD